MFVARFGFPSLNHLQWMLPHHLGFVSSAMLLSYLSYLSIIVFIPYPFGFALLAFRMLFGLIACGCLYQVL